jgi:hypothetical protein
MSTDEWWEAERKAAEFWRKVKENQTAWHSRGGPSHAYRPASVARFGQFGNPARRRLPKI